MATAFIFGLKGAQLIIVILVILLLFGANKIPQIMRNLGKGVHSFKQGIEDAKEEINREVVKHDTGSANNDKTGTEKSEKE